MADKKDTNLIVADMRDYALITLMKTIRRLELLDEKRNNESDIAKIRRYIGMFVKQAFNGNVEENTANSVFDKFPEVLEIAEEKEETKANALTKELMKSWRKALLNQITEYKKLSENDCETVILNAEKVYEEVFKPFIDTHNKARRNKDNQIDRKEFVKSFIRGDIDENMEKFIDDTRKKVKDKIINKLKEQKQDTTRKPLFREEINSIVPGLEIDYSIAHNTPAFQQAIKKVRSYFSKADAKTYKNLYSQDHTARKEEEGPKEDALRYMGYMAEAGYRQIHYGVKPSLDDKDLKECFDNFKEIMKKNYPQDTEEIINNAFGIAKNADRNSQFKAFADKSASFYTQMFGGFMQLYTDTLHKNPNKEFPSTFRNFIAGMQNGSQNVHIFSMYDVKKDNGTGSIKSQQSDEQYSNMDHKIPVAVIIPLYIMIHPELGGKLDPNKLKKEQLLELAELAAKLGNNLGNIRLVISKETNKKGEANGHLVLDKDKDNSILAVSYSLPVVKEALKEIFNEKSETCERYTEAFAKYTKSDERGVITTNLNLPEAQEIDRLRKENSTDKNILDVVKIMTENALTIRK